MDTFGIAVKAFIVEAGKVLIVRRRDVDPHNAGSWEFPGGRIEMTEDLPEGLEREVREETGLVVEVLFPFEAHTFVRDDRQFIVMVTYLCKAKDNQIRLSAEHQEYEWVALEEAASRSKWLQPIVENFQNFKLSSFL